MVFSINEKAFALVLAFHTEKSAHNICLLLDSVLYFHNPTVSFVPRMLTSAEKKVAFWVAHFPGIPQFPLIFYLFVQLTMLFLHMRHFDLKHMAHQHTKHMDPSSAINFSRKETHQNH